MSQVPEKRKIQPTVKETVVTGWGCLLAAIMLGLGFTIGIGASIYFVPQLMHFDATEAALAEREVAIELTEIGLVTRGENARATDAALGDEGLLLNQTATQSQLNIYATQTMSGIENSMQQTQTVLELNATQAQAEHNATESRINIQNTQAALGVGVEVSVTESPLSVSTSYSHNFAQGILASAWRSSANDDWALSSDGVWSQRKGAWLLSNALYGNSYHYAVTFNPVLQQESDYFFLVGFTGNEGIVIQLHAENLETTELAFYRFTGLINQNPIDINQMELLDSIAYAHVLQSQTEFSLAINGESLSLQLDGKPVFSTIVPQLQAGAIGVQMPQNALLRHIRVEVD